MVALRKVHQDVPARRLAIFREIGLSSAVLIAFGGREDHDANLTQLTMGVGQAAANLGSPLGLRDRLVRIAAFCVGWLKGMGYEDVMPMINGERDRVTNLYRTHPNKYLVRMDSPITDNRRKMRVMVEELGEIALAIDLREQVKRPGEHHQIPIKLELVQLAAVAVAWLETPACAEASARQAGGQR